MRAEHADRTQAGGGRSNVTLPHDIIRNREDQHDAGCISLMTADPLCTAMLQKKTAEASYYQLSSQLPPALRAIICINMFPLGEGPTAL